LKPVNRPAGRARTWFGPAKAALNDVAAALDERIGLTSSEEEGRDGERSFESIDELLDRVTAHLRSTAHLQRVLHTHAEAVVESVFAPLAAREPGDEERAHYVRRLQEGASLKTIAQEIAASESKWQRAVRTTSDELVQHMYRGVLGRDADPQGLATHVAALLNDGDLAALIASTNRSAEHERIRFVQSRNALREALQRVDGASDSVSKQLIPHVERAENPDDIASALSELTKPDVLWKDALRANADELAKDAYAAVLDRQPDPAGLHTHSTALKHHLSVRTLVQGLVKSKEHENNQFVRIRRSMQDEIAAYSALSAQIDVRTIERAGQVKSGAELLASLLHSLNPELEHGAHYHRKHPQIGFRPVGLGRLRTPRPLGVIFVPSEAWLPFALAIAEYFRQSQSLESVLVYQEWSPAISDACALSSAVFDVVELQTLLAHARELGLRPSFVVSHSFGWLPQTRSLLARFNSASFFTYADAFKNEMDSILDEERNIIGGFYFGYQPEGRKVRAQAILPANEIVRHIEAIANCYEFSDNFQTELSVTRDYALVYLRYWGTGPYAFSLAEVARCIVDTVMHFSDKSYVLVLKRDPRAHPDLYATVDSALREAGYVTEDFGSLLTCFGVGEAYEAMPVEYFFSKGLLCDAAQHFVFDSSLSFHIAVAPRIMCDTEIIIGAKLDGLVAPDTITQDAADIDSIEHQLDQERGSAPRSALAGVKTIQRYSRHYFDAVMNHTAPRRLSCAFVSDGLYQVKLHSVEHQSHEQH
jgi:hypothetical protein